MAYNEQVLHRARLRLKQAKEECEAEAAARRADLYAAYPRLEEIERELRRTMAKTLAAAFRKGEDPTVAISAIKEKNLALQRERDWIIEANDLDETILEPAVVCPHCKGTGYVGAVMCECLQELCRQEQKAELSSLLGGRESFDQFRLDYYPAEVDPQTGISPRALMLNTFNHCRRYAKNFSLKSPSLLFSGGPGLGKTFLSACIARTVADNGYSVVYDTAERMFSDFEAVKFGGNSDSTIQKYLSCDLLIIDDLGTEMITQFTHAVLYRVVNIRLMDCKPVIISTNLSSDGILQRYTGPIASRLLGSYELCLFLGKDIRRLKKD